MLVDTWGEIRTAYQVARLGTVSGAAEAPLLTFIATVVPTVWPRQKNQSNRHLALDCVESTAMPVEMSRSL